MRRRGCGPVGQYLRQRLAQTDGIVRVRTEIGRHEVRQTPVGEAQQRNCVVRVVVCLLDSGQHGPHGVAYTDRGHPRVPSQNRAHREVAGRRERLDGQFERRWRRALAYAEVIGQNDNVTGCDERLGEAV